MGEKTEAGEGLSDEETVKQVGEQTDSEPQQKDHSAGEKDGAMSDAEVAKAGDDGLGGAY
jgi:hypothetical protein